MSFFLSRLVDELQMLVKMFKPKTLSEANLLAKLQEMIVVALKNQPKPFTKTPQVPFISKPMYQGWTNNNLPPKQNTNDGLLPTPNIPKLLLPIP